MSTQVPAAHGADLASLTIGGNDLGFTQVVTRCIHDVAFNPDGLCTSDPMINGITLVDLGDSFHPTARGATIAAHALAEAIAPRVG